MWPFFAILSDVEGLHHQVYECQDVFTEFVRAFANCAFAGVCISLSLNSTVGHAVSS